MHTPTSATQRLTRPCAETPLPRGSHIPISQRPGYHCRLYLHRITSTVISELTRGQIRPKLDHDDVFVLLARGIAKASLLAE